MNITTEYHQQLYQDLEQDRIKAQNASRARLSCPECESSDGMRGWHVTVLLERVPDVALYADDDDGEYLYSACPICKRALYAVPPGYRLLSQDQVFEWIHPPLCDCAAEGQVCAVCCPRELVEWPI